MKLEEQNKFTTSVHRHHLKWNHKRTKQTKLLLILLMFIAFLMWPSPHLKELCLPLPHYTKNTVTLEFPSLYLL